ncbi:MAG: hypothetical protein KGP14_00970 [Betaproteobacteria bacterium]|nr:hypothetical protein [Betaproteobacteria bacterium]
MSSLATFSGLKAAIADWLHRADLTTRIPDFIALAEARITNDISDITLLLSEGQIVTAAGQRKYPAPSGFIRLNYAYRREPASTPMQIVSPRALAEKYAFEQYTSIPNFLAFDGVNIVVHPTPNGAYTIDYTMQDMVTPLSDTAPANVILTRFPGMYLWGACHEAAIFIRDNNLTTLTEQKYQAALTNARSVDYLGDATLRTDVAMRSGGSFNFYTGD